MSHFNLKLAPATHTAVVYTNDGKFTGRYYWFCWWFGFTFGPLLLAITNAKAIYFGEKKPGKRRTLFRIEWR